MLDSDKQGIAGSSYRGFVAGIYASVALCTALLMQHSLGQIDADIANIARERGSVLFRLIELTRDWNAQHGGVYVPVTEKTQPNPYLKHPKRDIVDGDGRKLTMVNPAFMTRQISEIAVKAEGVRFHITSLKPIRPANEADAWEKESLGLFERTGLQDRLDFFADGGGVIDGPAHRYMAPLVVKPACMKCHESQGYKVGDIRGGISVSMPSERLMGIAQQRRDQVVVLYLLGGILIAWLGHMVAWRTRRHMLALEDINRQQEAVIEERTHELSEANAALKDEMAMVTAVFGNVAEAIMVTDADNKILRVNPAFTSITGYKAEEVIGKTPAILHSGRHDEAFFADMWRHIKTLGKWEGEVWNRRKNGDVYVEWLSITTLHGEADEARYIATFIDITKRKETEQSILHRANFDSLTDLPNRNLFEDRLLSVLAMARRHRRSFGLMYIDLDWFKNVNDSYGHTAGDELLVEAAKRMEKCVRDTDTLARVGGDEFALILSDLSDSGESREAEEVAQRINHTMAEPFVLSDGVAKVSASIGIAIFPQDGSDELLLKKAADDALYAAKAAGRNTYRLWSSK